MTWLKHYTGAPLNPLAEQVCEALREAHFDVDAHPPNEGNPGRNIIRICWRDVFIGKLHADFWKKGFGCMYRFLPSDGYHGYRFAAPAGYSKERFIKTQAVSEGDFFVEGAARQDPRYFLVRGLEATLKVMQHSAREVDKLLGVVELFTSGPASDVHEADGTAQTPSAAGTRADSDSAVADILAIVNSKASATQKTALIETRLGQGKFRADLGAEFDWTCPVSGLNLPYALRASHIVAWSVATPEERQDPLNGLLLSANIDALFDRHFLTITRDGKLRFSRVIKDWEKAQLGPYGNLEFAPCAKRSAFLSRHERLFEALEKERARVVKRSQKEN